MDASVEAAAPEPGVELSLMPVRYVRDSKTAFPTGDPCATTTLLCFSTFGVLATLPHPAGAATPRGCGYCLAHP